MGTSNSSISENEKLEIIIQEFTEEQKSTNQKYDDMVKAFNELSASVSNFKGILENHKVIGPEPDVRSIRQIVETGKEEMKLILETALRKIHADRWRIFLESDAKRWFVYLLVSVVFLTYLYFFSVHAIDHK